MNNLNVNFVSEKNPSSNKRFQAAKIVGKIKIPQDGIKGKMIIERNFEIHKNTQKLFDKLGIRAALIYGDGTIGWEEAAPYDRIIVTAGGPEVPNRLLSQLAVGGKMVIPVGDRNCQAMQIITKVSGKEYSKKEVPNFKFVPLIGKQGWKSE